MGDELDVYTVAVNDWRIRVKRGVRVVEGRLISQGLSSVITNKRFYMSCVVHRMKQSMVGFDGTRSRVATSTRLCQVQRSKTELYVRTRLKGNPCTPTLENMTQTSGHALVINWSYHTVVHAS
jgi:hypothetical protein